MHFGYRKRARMDAKHYEISRRAMSWIGQWPEQMRFSRIFLSFNLILSVGSQLCLLVSYLQRDREYKHEEREE